MNRRSYIKNSLIFGGIGVTSFSIFKWFSLNEPIDPTVLSNKEDLLAELVDLIIPETDTPGARTANVHQYIINVIVNCNPPKEQQNFLNGLIDLEDYATSHYSESFLKCTITQKTAILKNFAAHSGYSNRLLNKINTKLLGEPFYLKLRRLTVEGYCLSLPGATEGLAYDYIPGKHEACVPLLANQRSWATK